MAFISPHVSPAEACIGLSAPLTTTILSVPHLGINDSLIPVTTIPAQEWQIPKSENLGLPIRPLVPLLASNSFTQDILGLKQEFERIATEVRKVRGRYLSLCRNLEPAIREDYEREFRDLAARFDHWRQQLVPLVSHPQEARLRFAQDLKIALSVLFDRVLRFGSLIYSEPIDPADQGGLRLRSRLLHPPERRSREKPETRPAGEPGVLPALVNHNVGYGSELTLRPHQQIAWRAIGGWLRSQRDQYGSYEPNPRFLEATIVMPVGGGKTRLMVAAFAAVIEQDLFDPSRGDRLIILNHTGQIHSQNRDILKLLKPFFKRRFQRELKISEYKADVKDLSGDVVVVSLPTINNQERLQVFQNALRKNLGEHGKIPMVAVDEIHHLELGSGVGRLSWKNALEGLREVFPSFFRIGFTATPTGREPNVLYKVSERALMLTGVTPRTYLVKVPGIELTKLKVSQAGDFQERELASALLEHPERNEHLYQALEAKGMKVPTPSPSGREGLEPVLGFAADLKHALMMAEQYQTYFGEGGGGLKGRRIEILGKDRGKMSARDLKAALGRYRRGEIDALIALVSGETKDRDMILEAVEKKEIEAVFTVDALVEGADLHMFRHQLGSRPTLSKIKKGQERGRINRRSPEEVDPHGRLLSDPPRILFDVIDLYHSYEKYLVHYGMVMGIRHSRAVEGELFDALTETSMQMVDREGKRIKHPSIDEVLLPQPPFEIPSQESPRTAIATLLREILASRYDNDLEKMARDLGEPEEFVADLLAGIGWENNQWFFRRLATLLYQEREIFVRRCNGAPEKKEREKTPVKLDKDMMIYHLRGVIEEAEKKGERISPWAAADRSRERYCQSFPSEEFWPSSSFFRQLISLNEKTANPQAMGLLKNSSAIEKRATPIDERMMINHLSQVLEHAEQKGERLTPTIAARRTWELYCAGLAPDAKRPSHVTFKMLICLNKMGANPEAFKRLQDSPLVERTEHVAIDYEKIIACLGEVLKEAAEKGETLNRVAAARRTWERYGSDMPLGEPRPSRGSFVTLFSSFFSKSKGADPHVQQMLRSSPVIEQSEQVTIDQEKMIDSLGRILEEAAEKGEKLGLATVVNRTWRRYCASLDPDVTRPSVDNFRRRISFNEKNGANPQARALLESFSNINYGQRGKVDVPRLLVALRKVIEEATKRGERLMLGVAATRTCEIYCQGLPEEEWPSESTLRGLISFSQKVAHPEAMKLLKASEAIEHGNKGVDTQRLTASLLEVIEEARQRGERLNLAAAARRVHEVYCRGLPKEDVRSESTFKGIISFNQKVAHPEALDILKSSEVIESANKAIDINRMIACLKEVLEAAKVKKEKLTPKGAARRTHELYYRDLPEEERPSLGRFQEIITLHEKTANPRALEILRNETLVIVRRGSQPFEGS